jgi:muramoyltetrapeptide carboxypeptidase LdcA involved in peptidoglycan recycling
LTAQGKQKNNNSRSHHSTAQHSTTRSNRPYLYTPGVGHEVQRLVLIPLGELAAAEEEAELFALGQLGHQRLLEGPRAG